MPYAVRMKELVDSFWRAAAYCLHPKVILLSLLPLLFSVTAVLGLGWFYWERAVAGVRAWLEQWTLVLSFLQWLESIGAAAFYAMLAPLIVVALAVPLVVVASLLLVAWLMTPSLVNLVAARRFETLERMRGAGWFSTALWSIGCMLLALLLLGLSLPLWFIPPLVLVLPPLIWGWLTYKVMSFEVLAEHASADERRQLMRDHHWPLLAIGIVTGYLGAAPTLLWAVSAATLVLAPVLVVVSVWLYTLVFAFAALWFAHFALTALQRLRQQSAVVLEPPRVLDAPPLPVPAPPPALPGAAPTSLAPP
jgi:Etoposide-induced protein 2.4 (EI24)